MSRQHDQTIALAGLIQSCVQVDRIAQFGYWDSASAQACIYSLFQIEASSVNDVYQGSTSLSVGLKHLKAMLEKNIERSDVNITRYAVSLLHLEQKLIQNEQMLNTIRQGLYQIDNEFDISDIENTTMLSRLADIYVNTVSTIQPKIQVEGNREHLTLINNTYRVRSMLFAGIRSAVLWRQLGGSRWKLFFGRRQLLTTVNQILEA